MPTASSTRRGHTTYTSDEPRINLRSERSFITIECADGNEVIFIRPRRAGRASNPPSQSRSPSPPPPPTPPLQRPNPRPGPRPRPRDDRGDSHSVSSRHRSESRHSSAESRSSERRHREKRSAEVERGPDMGRARVRHLAESDDEDTRRGARGIYIAAGRGSRSTPTTSSSGGRSRSQLMVPDDEYNESTCDKCEERDNKRHEKSETMRSLRFCCMFLCSLFGDAAHSQRGENRTRSRCRSRRR